MARPRKTLGDSSSKVVEKNFLEEVPEDTDASIKVVKMTHIPEYKKMVFHNARDPGQPLYFHYASATHPLKLYTLYDGKTHNLPVEVIEHLESCAENKYKYGFNPESERQESYITSRDHYFSFRQPPKGAVAA